MGQSAWVIAAGVSRGIKEDAHTAPPPMEKDGHVIRKGMSVSEEGQFGVTGNGQ
jgi:hypothetical protein